MEINVLDTSIDIEIVGENPVEILVDKTIEAVEVIEIVGENSIEVVSPRIVETIEIVDVGPQGPRGDVGAFIFTQTAPLFVWNINHNLGVNPSVECTTFGGLNIEGSVLHLSTNQLTITFNTETSGIARLL